MGLKQLLFIMLSLILVGLAIALGIQHFNYQQTLSNKDGVGASLANIAVNAYQYKSRPVAMSGGGGVYDNSMGGKSYAIPLGMVEDGYGKYSLVSVSPASCTIKGISVMETEWIATCSVDENGRTTFSFSGW
ncbi:MAG: hypothetical protein ABSF91_10545 [Bacteroidota bacterium]|jgi:hypothetical protein